ncbi:MAG: glycosyltransferase family 2 protein [Planctomycetota bacterium]
MTEITVIAAACNEMAHAEQWLAHLEWVDRVIVVDTGSRDGTADFLAERGVEVLQFTSQSPAVVHAAKNEALATVEGGWVLDLDLDERVTLPLRAEIEAAVTSAAAVAAYRLPFRHYVFGRWLKHGGWRTQHLRLYRAGSARYPEDRAHSTLQVDGETADLNEFVVHFAHPRLHDFVVKMNRYTSQDAQLLPVHGRGGLRNRPPLPATRFAYMRATTSVFWSRYVKEAGFLDGVPGFLAAWLLASYVFVEQGKVWEAQHAAGGGADGDGNSGADVDHSRTP